MMSHWLDSEKHIIWTHSVIYNLRFLYIEVILIWVNCSSAFKSAIKSSELHKAIYINQTEELVENREKRKGRVAGRCGTTRVGQT